MTRQVIGGYLLIHIIPLGKYHLYAATLSSCNVLIPEMNLFRFQIPTQQRIVFQIKTQQIQPILTSLCAEIARG